MHLATDKFWLFHFSVSERGYVVDIGMCVYFFIHLYGGPEGPNRNTKLKNTQKLQTLPQIQKRIQ